MEGAFLFFVLLTVIGSLWGEYKEEALSHVEKEKY